MQWLYKLSIGVIILFCSCVGSFILNFVFGQLALSNNSCSANNTVYQAMKNMTANEWYSRANIRPAEVLKTDTRYYLAEVYKSDQTANLIYVSVGSERDGLSGTEGFLYLLSEQAIPQYWFDNYWITHLEDNAYCYNIRGF
jgi:hypothetical protein